MNHTGTEASVLDRTRPVVSIQPSQVTPALKALFDPGMPTGIHCFAVLAGGNAGKILTDDADCPQWAYVWEVDDGTLYRGGRPDREVLADVIARLRQEGRLVALGFRADDPAVELFPPDPNAGADCLEFDRPAGDSDLSPYWNRLAARYEIRRMDRALLERSPKCDENTVRYGSLDNLLSQGLAVCVLRGEEIVCEAHADMEVLGRREVGIVTQKAYRGQGLATAACAYLIKLCDDSGCHTYWDCVKLNQASAAVARKLGFRNERRYRLLAWFSGAPEVFDPRLEHKR